MQTYDSFIELKDNEAEGKDYCIRFRKGKSGILVMAPHAGDIEPATGELADAIAGNEHSFYGLWGLKAEQNAVSKTIAAATDDATRALKIDEMQKLKEVLQKEEEELKEQMKNIPRDAEFVIHIGDIFP